MVIYHSLLVLVPSAGGGARAIGTGYLFNFKKTYIHHSKILRGSVATTLGALPREPTSYAPPFSRATCPRHRGVPIDAPQLGASERSRHDWGGVSAAGLLEIE